MSSSHRDGGPARGRPARDGIARGLPARGRTAAAAALTAGLATLLAVSACTSPSSAASSAPAATSTPSSTGSTGSAGSAGSAGSTRSTGSAGPIVPTASTLRWHACSGELALLRVPDCTTLSVPLNYADPRGRHISLALDMIPATAPRSRQQGILLVNPGGPGGSGLSLAVAVAQGLAPGVTADYDIVGFDPRGVGSSVPALSCDPGFFSGARPNYTPANPAAEQAQISLARLYAADCEQKFGWLLPHMTTEDTARDLDSIRTAFGVSKINYYAFSYGTYLGQVYATLFPTRVRRMVLDSTVDPTGVWYTDNRNQDYAFDKRQNAFYAWMARYDRAYHLGQTAASVRAAYYRARNRLAADPINGQFGPDELDDTVLVGGYDDELWPGLAQALSVYVNYGQSASLITQYQAHGTQGENGFAVYHAVECSDVNWPRSWAFWTSDTELVYRAAPFEAWPNAWFNAACAFWPVHGPARPLQIRGAGLPGILMLQGTLDAATPYAGAQDAHKLLPSARMVVVTGSGNHGQSLDNPPDACVQNYLNAYLATGALPHAPGLVNATCPAVPVPAL